MKSTGILIVFTTALSAGILSGLPIRTAHAQEAFQVDVTQESITLDNKTGQVTVTGTVTCSEPTQAYVGASVTQPVGRKDSVEGGSAGPFACDPDGEPYALSFFARQGRFAPGRAVIRTDAWACGSVFCDDTFVEQAVRLKP